MDLKAATGNTLSNHGTSKYISAQLRLPLVVLCEGPPM